MGKTTFVKSRDGFRAQEKVIVPAGRFQNAPSFARVRENASEFGGAGTSGKVIREAINSLLPGIADPRMVSRLLQRVSKVIKSDTVSPRGKGNVVDGNTLLLKDFEFNVNTKLKSVFRPKFTTDINRVTGQLTLNVPVHTPNLDLAVPKDCTHYQFISAGVEINFEHQSSKEDIHVSAYLPVGLTATTALAIVHTVTPNSTEPLFLVFGVRFFLQDRGIMYPLLDASSNGLKIADVSKV